MQINFTGRNIDVTPALKSVTTEKMQKLERHSQSIGSVNVTFHLEHITHVAEATLHLDGTDIHASAKSDDMYNAVDSLVEKLLAQITKHKEKHSGHR